MDPSGLVFLGLMVVVFYFLLIRPQQRRLKQHQALVGSLKTGDEVVTIGGLYGRVERLDETNVWLEVADATVLRFSRQSISKKIEDEAGEQAGQDADVTDEG